MSGRRALWLLAALAFLPGCSALYVLRAGYEEAKILWRRTPIDQLLQKPDLPADTRAKLELVLSVREYARQIGLRVGGSYGSFAEIGQDQVVYVVSAAERFRLQPYTWWFPVVGRVPYKGFFKREDATAEAEELEKRGFDTDVFPSIAFSTLGWFNDPLLSNLLRYEPVVLAEVVLHELFHSTFYPPGQTAFNESIANFVGARGTIDYFTRSAGENSPEAVRARMLWDDALAFSEYLETMVRKLRAAYAAGITLEERAALFRELQAEFSKVEFQTKRYSDFGREKLNNAVVLHDVYYYKDLDVFERVYERSGDMKTFVAEIIAAARGEGDPFAAVRKKFGIAPDTDQEATVTALEGSAPRARGR